MNETSLSETYLEALINLFIYFLFEVTPFQTNQEGAGIY